MILRIVICLRIKKAPAHSFVHPHELVGSYKKACSFVHPHDLAGQIASFFNCLLYKTYLFSRSGLLCSKSRMFRVYKSDKMIDCLHSFIFPLFSPDKRNKKEAKIRGTFHTQRQSNARLLKKWRPHHAVTTTRIALACICIPLLRSREDIPPGFSPSL